MPTGQIAGWILTVFTGTALMAQDAAKLTAREVFYAEAPQQAPIDKPVKAVTPRPKSTPKPGQTTAHQEPPRDQNQTEQARKNPVPVETHQEAPVSVTLAKLSADPLGLRVTLLKQVGAEWVEVDRDSVFHPEDHTQINVEANDHGYVYIVARQSSGIWKPMFPSPEVPDTNNEVQPHVRYQLPPRRVFTVANPPGIDKLFVVLSRNPHLDMGALATELGHRQPDRLQTTYAMNRPIDDAMVNRMRETNSRDLIIEQMDDVNPGPKKEKAVYAVNVAGGAEAWVFLDVEIKHP